jgi:hypothetical protein
MNLGRSFSLPHGWQVRRDSTWGRGGHLLGRHTVYSFPAEGLEVRRAGRRWMLTHNFHDTGHRFKTARLAIEHADDARIHGG